MLDLHRVGVFVRNGHERPLKSVERLFERARIELVHDLADHPQPVDLVIALGGDGTVLRALVANPGIPVLAVNFGTVGFLTQCDRDDLDKVLVRLLADDYQIEERLALQVFHRETSIRCINEVVVRGGARMVMVDLIVNDRLVHSLRGDGVIVGTPTGSTAYLMSTGAPLVTPHVDCVIINPLNEYNLSSRAIVVPGDVRVRLQVWNDRHRKKGKSDIRLTVDGKERLKLKSGDVIEVSRSDIPARLVYFESEYFFQNLRKRLNW